MPIHCPPTRDPAPMKGSIEGLGVAGAPVPDGDAVPEGNIAKED